MHVPVLSIDLAEPLGKIANLGLATKAHVLFLFSGEPLWRQEVSIREGSLSPIDIAWALSDYSGDRNGAGCGRSDRVREKILEQWLGTQPEKPHVLPSCSVIVCTRDRPNDLRRCLESLAPSVRENVEVIVIDNDPSDERTAQLAGQFRVRYCLQPRRGLNWARSLGAQVAKNEILLFVDDDVVVSPRWVDELRAPFLEEHVGAAAGAVEPLELSTDDQYLHEQWSSFYRGFRRREFNLTNISPAGSGQIGAGANMAVRRSLATALQLFEVELDAGTPAKSGGDSFALCRVLHAGYSAVFEPRALCWHRHRATRDHLETMLHGYSIGAYCMLLNAYSREKDWDSLLIGLAWFRHYHLKGLWESLQRRPWSRPLDLVLLEIRGVLTAPVAYWRCRRRELAIGPLTPYSAFESR